MASARRAAINVFGGALVALAEIMKEHYPDEEERHKFAERVKTELENPEYRLYSVSYESLLMLLTQMDCDWPKARINQDQA
jgi:hypothetical protein